MQSVAQRSRTKAAATNTPQRIAGVDGRTAAARRFRDLVDDLTTKAGGAGALAPLERALIRQAAALMLRTEQLQASIVRGDTIDDDKLVRVSGEARRVISSLKGQQRGDDIDDFFLDRQER